MRFAGQFVLCLAAAAWISPAVHADDLAMADNPYAAISERNIFALVPIPTNPPVSDTPPVDPPPKITVNGIMTLFGQLEVLFKVADKPPPGQPAKDLSCELGVGDRQDDVEVKSVDDKATIPTVTFINHGVEQVIPLDDAPKITSSTPPPVISGGGMNHGMMGRGLISNPGGVPMPGGPANNGGGIRFRGALGGGGLGGGGAGAATSSSYNSGSAAAPTADANVNPSDPTAASAQMTEEERIVAMEQQRAKWLDEGNPAAAIIPETPLGKKLIGGENTTPSQ